MEPEVGLLILKIGIVIAIGFIGSILAKKVKLPNVSGYLVLGLLLGPSMGLIFKGFPGVITADDGTTLNFISEIALAFIAFSIGSEFSIKSIKKMGREVTVLTAMEVIGAVVLVFFALLFVPKPFINDFAVFGKENIAFCLILASMSAATAPAATLMVIRQYRSYGPVTKTILPITALDDIFGIVVFGFFLSFAQILTSQTSQPLWLMILKPFIEVFGSIIIGFIIGFILSKIAKQVDKNRDDIQVVAIFSIFLTIGGIMVINQALDGIGIAFSQLLANIMVGATVTNMLKKPDKTFNSINDLSVPFYVVFFTLAGASLDLSFLGKGAIILLVAAVYIIARGCGKMLGITAGAHIAKSERTIKKYLGMALLPQGGVSIGLLVIVAAQIDPLLSKPITTIIMLSILVYETSGPIFAKLALSKSGEMYALDKLHDLSNIDEMEDKKE